MTTVLIYEDNNDLRAGIAKLLQLKGEFLVAGTFANCDHIYEEVIVHQPELIIMDIDMPGTNGLKGIGFARQACSEVKILMYTVFDDDEKIFAAITAGADGYLLKKVPPAKLVEALHDLKNDESPMSPAIARKMLNYFAAKNVVPPGYSLTDKEKIVLKHLTMGLSNKMIGAEMGIGIETVRSHLKHVYNKLHVNSNTQAVSKAINERLI